MNKYRQFYVLTGLAFVSLAWLAPSLDQIPDQSLANKIPNLLAMVIIFASIVSLGILTNALDNAAKKRLQQSLDNIKENK